MKTIFENDYYGETLGDVEQDVSEAIADIDVPVDEHGFPTGKFIVTITWSLEE